MGPTAATTASTAAGVKITTASVLNPVFSWTTVCASLASAVVSAFHNASLSFKGPVPAAAGSINVEDTIPPG